MILQSLSLPVFASLTAMAGAPEAEDFNLVAAAERYCFAAYGNHVRTRQWVDEDGFAPLAADGFGDLRLPGARYLRGYSKTIGRTEVRVLTGLTRFRGFNQGENVFRMCWVSASPWERLPVETELRRTLGVDRFRMEGAYVYAWATTPGGTRRRVSRREFTLTALRDAQDADMQFVLTNERRGMVAITYMTPTASMDDPEIVVAGADQPALPPER